MKKFLLLALTAGWSLSAMAQKELRLTLPRALEIAHSENPTIRVADLEVQRYDYVKRQTWGNLLPQLSADATYSRAIKKQEMAKGISFGADNTLTGTATASLPLFAPQIYALMKMNRMQAEGAVEAARSSRIELTAAVKKAFYNILLAQQSLGVLKESEALIERTVSDTQLKYDNGLASEYDLLTAQVQLSNLQPTILQTENSIAVACLLMKMYLSIPEDIDVTVEGELNDLTAQVEAAEVLTTDVDSSSKLRSLDIQADVLRQSLRVQNASRLPTLGAFGSYTISGSDTDLSRLTGQPSDGSMFWQQPITAGVKLTIPIFAGTTKSAAARSIRNQMSQLDLQRKYAHAGVRVEVETAINNLLTARETMHAQEKTVAQAIKAYDISATRYGAGAGTILELNSAQLARTQAQLSYSQAIYDYLSARAEYDRIIGKEK